MKRCVECGGNFDISMMAFEYRLKPEQEWTPWTRETCPHLGCCVHDAEGDERMIVAILADGVYIGGDDSLVTWQQLFDEGYTYSGHPCGTRAGE